MGVFVLLPAGHPVTTEIVPIPPHLWARMSHYARQRAIARSRDVVVRAARDELDARIGAAIADEARHIHASLPPDDPAVCVHRAAICISAIYGTNTRTGTT